MGRFIKKVFIYILVAAVCVLIIPAVVDPYNVFHWRNIRNNGVEPNKNYIKTKYIIDNPELFNGFLFGSSRVGAIHVENIKEYSVYNMTYSAGTPYEHLQTIHTFLENGIIPKIIMGVDNYSYKEDYNFHLCQGLRAPYQSIDGHVLNFAKLYLDPSAVTQSLPLLVSDKGIPGYDYFYKYGWWCDYECESHFNRDDVSQSISDYDNMPDTLKVISEIKQLCDENGIKLILFINPIHELEFIQSVEHSDFFIFLEELAKIAPFYNFSGINQITEDDRNYVDYTHYNAQVGDLIIDTIFDKKRYDSLYENGFGWYVDENNIVDLLSVLNQQYVTRLNR